MMRPAHLRMARAALGWTLGDLANKAGVNLNTISRYESGRETLSGTIQKIEDVFRSHGLIFIDSETYIGVQLPTSGRSPHQAAGTKKRKTKPKKIRNTN